MGRGEGSSPERLVKRLLGLQEMNKALQEGTQWSGWAGEGRQELDPADRWREADGVTGNGMLSANAARVVDSHNSSICRETSWDKATGCLSAPTGHPLGPHSAGPSRGSSAITPSQLVALAHGLPSMRLCRAGRSLQPPGSRLCAVAKVPGERTSGRLVITAVVISVTPLP